MKVKCTKCGFEDEGKFCSNCGTPLQGTASLVEDHLPKQSFNASWLAVCPVCKSGELTQTIKKKLFGLAQSEKIGCNKCGAIFTDDGQKYKLAKVQDNSTLIWGDYGNQSLTEREWKHIAHGGLSDEKQEETDMGHWMTELMDGSVPLQFGGESPIILKKNEELQFALPNIMLSEPRTVSQTRGGYAGPTVRLAKGLSFRVGGFQAKSESHEELRSIDRGTLTLTNKRLVFSGSKRTVEAALEKLLSVEPLNDGIALRTSGKAKTQYFTGIDCAQVTFTVEDRKYEKPLSGPMLKYFIEGLSKHI